eukprot:971856-Prymnesium_polylepis.1
MAAARNLADFPSPSVLQSDVVTFVEVSPTDPLFVLFLEQRVRDGFCVRRAIVPRPEFFLRGSRPPVSGISAPGRP